MTRSVTGYGLNLRAILAEAGYKGDSSMRPFNAD